VGGVEDRTNLASGIDERIGHVDLQDIGARTWTYVGAMLNTMRAAARNHIPIILLDRPNSLNGAAMNGPLLDPTLANPEEHTAPRPGRAYALYPAPVRRGITMGGMAPLFNRDDAVAAWRRQVAPFLLYR
jgi:uncharacterized protein YbbC (DUF1343 family)